MTQAKFGTTCLGANSYVGKLKNSCVLEEQPFETVAESQMRRNCGKAYTSNYVMRGLRKGKVMKPQDWTLIFQMESALRFPMRILNYIKRKV